LERSQSVAIQRACDASAEVGANAADLAGCGITAADDDRGSGRQRRIIAGACPRPLQNSIDSVREQGTGAGFLYLTPEFSQ